MKLSAALKDKLFDVRLRDKLVFQGKISQKDVDEYLNSLADDGDKIKRIDETEGTANPATEQQM